MSLNGLRNSISEREIQRSVEYERLFGRSETSDEQTQRPDNTLNCIAEIRNACRTQYNNIMGEDVPAMEEYTPERRQGASGGFAILRALDDFKNELSNMLKGISGKIRSLRAVADQQVKPRPKDERGIGSGDKAALESIRSQQEAILKAQKEGRSVDVDTLQFASLKAYRLEPGVTEDMYEIAKRHAGEGIPEYDEFVAKYDYYFTKSDIYEAIDNNDLEAVRMFLPKHANDTDEKGQTPLHHACSSVSESNITPIIQALLEAGANPSIKDKYGDTALHEISSELYFQKYDTAADASPRAAAALLIDAGAEVNATNDHAQTPLHMAIHNDIDSMDTTCLLISNGAELNMPDSRGKTPLDILKKRSMDIQQIVYDYILHLQQMAGRN